jgi:hypothetical protein
MPLDHGVIGVATPPYERSWTSTDTLLYALGLGAGQDDSAAELNLTTEKPKASSSRHSQPSRFWRPRTAAFRPSVTTTPRCSSTPNSRSS